VHIIIAPVFIIVYRTPSSNASLVTIMLQTPAASGEGVGGAPRCVDVGMHHSAGSNCFGIEEGKARSGRCLVAGI
jgi:hypothetical protein